MTTASDYHIDCSNVNIDNEISKLYIKCVLSQGGTKGLVSKCDDDVSLENEINKLNNSYTYISEMKCEKDITFPIINKSKNTIAMVDIPEISPINSNPVIHKVIGVENKNESIIANNTCLDERIKSDIDIMPYRNRLITNFYLSYDANKHWGLCYSSNDLNSDASFKSISNNSKSKDTIPADTSLFPYLGEYLSSKETKKRQKELYDPKGLNYVLTTREHIIDKNCVLRANIDATAFGNIARFINHSCDPNCHIVLYKGLVDSLISIPIVTTSRIIHSNEELTIDYGGFGFDVSTMATSDDDQSTSNKAPRLSGHDGKVIEIKVNRSDMNANTEASVRKNRKICNCGCRNCRKYLYTGD